MSPRRVAFLIVSLLVLVGVAAPAFGQSEGDASLRVDEVTTTDDAGYVIYDTESPADEVAVTVNGQDAAVTSTAPVADSDLDVYTLYVLDNSDTARTDTADQLAARVGVLRSLVEQAGPDERIAVLTTGGNAKLRIGFTRDRDRTLQTLDRIVASGPSALWQGVRGGALEFADVDADVARMVIVADQADFQENPPAAAARAEVLANDVYTYVVAVSGQGFPEGPMRSLADATGGGFVLAESFADLAAQTETVAAQIDSLRVTTFTSDAIGDGNALTLRVDGATRDLAMVPGASTTGPALTPIPPDTGAESFFASKRVLAAAIVLGGVAAALAVFAFVQLLQKPESQLTTALRAYGGEEAVEHANSARDLFEKAVEFTGDFAEKQGFLDTVEKNLEQADLALRPAEALVFQAGIVLASGAAFFLVTQSVFGLLIGLVLGAVVPFQVIKFKAARRRKSFVKQLPEMLQLLSSTLKAGYSFLQGVEAVSHEVGGAMGDELRRVITEAQLGRPVEDALEASAARMDSDDFAWAVLAVRIQREVGGNLSELLMTVSDTMVARNRLAGEVSALTAEGRISAIVLGAMPLVLGIVFYGMNPDYISKLWTTTIGYGLMAAGVVAALAGFAWMKKIITIRI